MELLIIFLCSLLFYPSQNLEVKVSQSLDENDEIVMQFVLDRNKPENDSVIGVNNFDKEEMYPVDRILKINSQLEGKQFEDVSIISGDIAVYNRLGNADRCASSTCRWPKARDGNVYIPYRISSSFSQNEVQVIECAMKGIQRSTCIRYRQHSKEKSYISIKPLEGCWSFVGRQHDEQELSLGAGCVYHGVVQHELLHALGFQHEHCRSDRDDFVNIYLQNVERGKEYAFARIDTNNLGTHYDYGSIMHYGKYAFSVNGRPTVLPKPDPNIPIGQYVEVSHTDIKKINKLYNC
ncbi:high choriolytic enzyme 1-like isoform X2 [Protopterus annectens]|nr:high choriolytic enzyme 1-like isoform X2 [Protopterus annectens]